MRIDRFEDIEAWKLARKLTNLVYGFTKRSGFDRDFALVRQATSAAGSVMHNIAEGFDAEGNTEFVRFLRYAKRSCSEVQSQLYIALDQDYIAQDDFDQAYNLAGRSRAAIKGFITYLCNR